MYQASVALTRYSNPSICDSTIQNVRINTTSLRKQFNVDSTTQQINYSSIQLLWRVMGTTCNIRPIQILNNVLKVRSAKRTHRKSIDRLTDCPTKSIGVPKTPYTVTEYTLSSTRCKYVKWVRYTIKLIVLIEV